MEKNGIKPITIFGILIILIGLAIFFTGPVLCFMNKDARYIFISFGGGIIFALGCMVTGLPTMRRLRTDLEIDKARENLYNAMHGKTTNESNDEYSNREKFCKYCGNIIDEDSEFCKYCGKKVN
ncbi:MAG: hypothetical protein J6Y28_00145 [Acholeplasmatales bacterium]|nr:hypothetical protein [Acholeplasmatales bacterium]